MKKHFLFIMILTIFLALAGCSAVDVSEQILTDLIENNDPVSELQIPVEGQSQGDASSSSETSIQEEGSYSQKEELAQYIHQYGHLPANFITKKEAIALGWESNKGNLWDVTDQMSIGGDYFGNREGLLPKADGRKWYECDVNYAGGYRGAERILYSNDGLVYYTDDHYASFTQLFDEGVH